MNNIKILIVEDQKIIARDLAVLLGEWGYQIVGCAATFEEAIALFNSEHPDIALIDIQLKGDKDGIETVKKMNEIRPIPIVYLTAQADTPTFERAKSSNPAAYLLKPFDERSLQISLDLAFDMFEKQYLSVQVHQKEENISANMVKLSADIILQFNDAIFIKQNYRFVKLIKEELILLEADRNYSYIHTKQQRHIIRMPLNMALEKLQYPSLVRVHRSFAVNIQNVKEFNDNEIVMNNNKIVPFSSAYREEFLKNFNVI
jgi:two-component system, response regulator PdtaR